MAKIKPISFNYDGSLIPKNGVTQAQIDTLAPKLKAAQNEVIQTDLQLYDSGEDVPEEKIPLDAGFHELPERVLDDYQADRANSELKQILATAAELQKRVDKVVVLGVGGSYLGARALMETCCQPYFNELTRAQRGGRPRMYFAGHNVDNDWTQGLLEFLRTNSIGDGPEGKWAIVVVSKSGDTLEMASAFGQFLFELEKLVGADNLADYVVPVTGASGSLVDLADAIGCKNRFLVPDSVGGRFSVLSPVGLLPAAILGIDVVALLEGAAAMNGQFRTRPLGSNPVLDYVAVNHLLEKEQGVLTRVLSVWTNSLESFGFWYDQLLAESLGKAEQGALPLTCVNSRDLHSRAQQHQEGARDKVINNVILDSWRFDPLQVGKSRLEQDRLDDRIDDLADKTLPDLMAAAITGTNLAYREDNRPTTDIHLPAADETSLGQLFQMMMLATVLEGRLLGINPYGQPGVQKYRNYVNQLLR